MKTHRSKFLMVGFILTSMTLFGCLYAGASQTPPAADNPEPIPGLEGKWRYTGESGTVFYDFTIEWDGQRYIVDNCVGYDPVVCEIQSQSWDGSTLTWTNYFSHTDYTTHHTALSVSGDELIVERSGTGEPGQTVYQRIP